MSEVPPDDHAPLNHILVLAPYRRDADYLQKLFAEHDIRVEICTDFASIGERLVHSPGVLVATHEALTPAVLKAVAIHLAAQPAWSEMPIVILLDRTSNQLQVRNELARAWPRARHIYYQRPVTPVELISGVQSALLARLRQRDVRDHIDREIELRRELNHRVKNILASVASIFEMTHRGADTLTEFADDFRGRLGALSKVHSAVFQAEDEAVSIGDIVDLTFEPYRLPGQNRVLTGGPVIMLTREAGTTLALCLHELATNAIKYGGLSTPDGSVSFTWSLSEADPIDLSVCWEESGGPTVVEPTRAGYGTRYLRSALASLFGAKPLISFDSGGLRCEVAGRVARVSCNS
ncbi:sensor histidine kinase [Sphingomonas sp. GB1N7]|uniref:sensor histidine kinase n=1 Tax=Parasphingomonas caseinilytica TaxID=3096158 RepID=UPI002FCA1826